MNVNAPAGGDRARRDNAYQQPDIASQAPGGVADASPRHEGAARQMRAAGRAFKIPLAYPHKSLKAPKFNCEGQRAATHSHLAACGVEKLK